MTEMCICGNTRSINIYCFLQNTAVFVETLCTIILPAFMDIQRDNNEYVHYAYLTVNYLQTLDVKTSMTDSTLFISCNYLFLI